MLNYYSMSLHPQIDLFISTSNFGLSSSRPKDQSLIQHGVLAFSSCESEVVTSCSHPGNSPEPLRFRLPDIACTTPPSALPAEHPSKYAASRYYPVARTRTPFRGHVPDVITTPCRSRPHRRSHPLNHRRRPGVLTLIQNLTLLLRRRLPSLPVTCIETARSADGDHWDHFQVSCSCMSV